MFNIPENNNFGAQIAVLGVGGAGGNALRHMIEMGLENVHFYALNTDLQALKSTKAENQIQLGPNLTRGLGSGGNPEIGRDAAKESTDIIKDILMDKDLIFIAAGEGGGTGTGASPVIAEMAKEMNVLTVAVVTKPFHYEGRRRLERAEQGIEYLREYTDTLLIIPNDKLLRLDDNVPSRDIFKMADNVLYKAVRGISDLITMPGFINLDFADLKTIMTMGGNAIIGVGEGEGVNKVSQAVELAIHSPLVEDYDIGRAKGILYNITSGTDITMSEQNQVSEILNEYKSEDAEVIMGLVYDESMENQIRITLIATGIDQDIKSSIKEKEKKERDFLLPPIREKENIEEPTVRRWKLNSKIDEPEEE